MGWHQLLYQLRRLPISYCGDMPQCPLPGMPTELLNTTYFVQYLYPFLGFLPQV